MREFGNFGCHAQVDQAVFEHRREKAQTDAEFLFFQGDGGGPRAAGLWHRDVDAAAGQEGTFLSVDGGDGRFGQDLDQVLVGTGGERALPVAAAPGDTDRTARALAGAEADARGHQLGQQLKGVAAGDAGHGQVHTQLVEQVARDFGHLDFEHDLLGAAHAQQVDDFLFATEGLGHVHGALHLHGVLRQAAEQQVIAQRFDLELVNARHPLGQFGLEGFGIGADGNVVQPRDAALAPDHEVGLAAFLAQEVNLSWVGQHHIGHIGVAHRHPRDVVRQRDQGGLARHQLQGLTTFYRAGWHGRAVGPPQNGRCSGGAVGRRRGGRLCRRAGRERGGLVQGQTQGQTQTQVGRQRKAIQGQCHGFSQGGGKTVGTGRVPRRHHCALDFTPRRTSGKGSRSGGGALRRATGLLTTVAGASASSTSRLRAPCVATGAVSL